MNIITDLLAYKLTIEENQVKHSACEYHKPHKVKKHVHKKNFIRMCQSWSVAVVSGVYAQKEHQQEQGTHQQSMMPMMMGGPEMQKFMMEHMQKCGQQMMNMMLENPRFMEKMLSMMLQHREAMKKALDNNPELKKQMEELLK